MRILIITLLHIVLFYSCKGFTADIEAARLNDEGVEALNKGNYDSAIYYFKASVTNQQASAKTKANTLRNMAQAFIAMEQNDSAIMYAQRAADLNKPGELGYYINIADVQILKGNTKEALINLTKAYTLDPKAMEVNNTLGLIYLGDYGDEFYDPKLALMHNVKARESSNSRTTQDVLARNYYELEQYVKAEQLYEQLQSTYPEINYYSLNLGMTKYHLGKYEAANELFSNAVASDSTLKDFITDFKETTDSSEKADSSISH